MRQTGAVVLACLCLSILSLGQVIGHEGGHLADDPRGVRQVAWEADDIDRVITAGYPVTFGLYAFSGRRDHKPVERSDRQGNTHACVEANLLAFDVSDDFAFDINETVTLSLLLDTGHNRQVSVGYDKHGSASASQALELPPQAGLNWHQVRLPGARLANRGLGQSDIALAATATMQVPEAVGEDDKTSFVLCDLRLTRTDTSPIAQTKRPIDIQFVETKEGVDATQTPVRFGLYDERGSVVLLREGILPVKYYETERHHLSLSSFYPPYQFWPHANRYFYYTAGKITAQLSPGRYHLVASKGPEYRLLQQSFEVSSDPQEGSNPIVAQMSRWQNLPQLGWYSGDVHIHMRRARRDNADIQAVLAAEDLHFSNLLLMSNLKGEYFQQYAVGEQGRYQDGRHHLVPGIEGPRTAHRGHTIALNIQQTLTEPEPYFLYHKWLDAYQVQGAATGYAHVGSGEFNAEWGLALDVPLGLVDFVEVMQATRLRTQTWYRFLNMGYPLAPAAGSDFPFFDQPGAVRSYVKADKDVELFGWYQNLQAGKTFVSNGPLLSLDVDGHGPGAALSLAELSAKNDFLTVSGGAQINTDFDRLQSLELIYCGETVASVSVNEQSEGAALVLEWHAQRPGSGWLALKARGQDYAIAHTGAVYLEDALGRRHCPGRAEQEIDLMLDYLEQLAHAELQPDKELEYWDSHKMPDMFNQQRPALLKQIEKVRQLYLQRRQALSN